MRIGVDIRCLAHKHLSGVGEYAYNLLDHLFKIDTRSEYILFYNSFKKPVLNIPKNARQKKTIASRWPNKLFNLSERFLQFPRIDTALKADKIFFPNYNFFSLGKDSPYILTVHDLAALKFPEFFSLKRRLWHRLLNIKKIIKGAGAVIAVSKSTKSDIIELCGVRKDKIKVIHSGVSSEYQPRLLTDLEMMEAKKRLCLPRRFILYLGTIEPRKNLENIIYAFEKLKEDKEYQDYYLVLAGSLGWSYKSILQAIRNSSQKEYIKYIGYVNNSDKPFLYNLCDLFIYPSLYEGFGFPLLEALACGTRALGSSNSSLSEISSEYAMLCHSLSIDEIVDKIKLLLNKKQDFSSRLGLSELIRNRYSWHNTAKKFLDFIRQ